ncbi:nucleotidyltransferase domain-containing protein [Sorangium sp. So ce1153]|uniref:nucleotidyltransferase domain-containing protein n=1 Tax=Sorangium sp. So ce1153 TaxID=3133333 RepID=UPI003F62780F
MAELSCALATLGLTLADLQRSAEQVVLFGSRAAGVGSAGSDWDLLVVGEGRTRHTQAVDLVWVSPRELATPAWLGSELAGHVARWGRWLHGAPDWVAEAGCGEMATEHKARRLASRLAALEQTWDLLSPAYRREHLTLFRRDLQRHALLAQGEAVPPSALLDETWQACADAPAEMLNLGSRAGLCSAFFETLATAGPWPMQPTSACSLRRLESHDRTHPRP